MNIGNKVYYNSIPYLNNHNKELETIKSKIKNVSIYDQPSKEKNEYNSCKIEDKNNNLNNLENNNFQNKYKFNKNDYYDNETAKTIKNSYRPGSFNENSRDSRNLKFTENEFKNYVQEGNQNNTNNSIIIYNSSLPNKSNPKATHNFNCNRSLSGNDFKNSNISQCSMNLNKNSDEKNLLNFQANKIQNLNYLNKNSKLSGFQILQTLYEGMCNFLIFAKACTPYINLAVSHLLDDTEILDYFKSFEKISAYGLDLNYINDQSISFNFFLKKFFK